MMDESTYTNYNLDDYKVNDKNMDIDTYDLYYNNEYIDGIIENILEIMERKNITFITYAIFNI